MEFNSLPIYFASLVICFGQVHLQAYLRALILFVGNVSLRFSKPSTHRDLKIYCKLRYWSIYRMGMMVCLGVMGKVRLLNLGWGYQPPASVHSMGYKPCFIIKNSHQVRVMRHHSLSAAHVNSVLVTIQYPSVHQYSLLGRREISICNS